MSYPELIEDLRRYLIDTLYSEPPDVRRTLQWVMNGEWFQDCRSLDWKPPIPLGVPVTLLGLPIVIREDGGCPHLEPMAAL